MAKAYRVHAVRALFVGLGLAGGLALAGCAPGAAVKQPVAQEEEVEQSPEIDLEFLKSVGALSVEEYLELPQADQLKYSMDAIEIFDLAAKVESASWATPSLDNSAQQIFENFRYALNTATAQSKPNAEAGEGFIFDTVEAEKLLSGAFDNTFDANPEPGFQNYDERREFILTLDKPYANTKPVTVEDYAPNTSMTKNGEELTYRDVLVHEADRESIVMRFVFRSFTDVYGEEASMWLHDSTRSAAL